MADKEQPLSAVDAAWLHMEEPTNLMTVTGVILLREPADFPRIRSLFEHRLLAFNRFRQRVVEGILPLSAPRWVPDPNFKLDGHLHHVALPAPGDKEALLELIGDLAGTPLDLSKPPWQCHVIDNVHTGSAVVLRFHHCIGDGMAIVAVMQHLLDTTPDAPLKRKLDHPRRPACSLWNTLWRSGKAVWNTSSQFAGTLWGAGSARGSYLDRMLSMAQPVADTAAIVLRTLMMSSDPATPFKGKLGVVKRVAWSEPVTLVDVKAIGALAGAKVNDVLLAAMTGALRHYLMGRGTAVNGLAMRAVVPVNLRPPERALDLGNEFGLVFLELPVGVSDPLMRLQLIQARMEALKSSLEPLVFFTLLKIFGNTPKQVEDQIVELFTRRATLVMTNVPGPQQTLYLAGNLIERVTFWVPQSGRLGLGVSIMSYNGTVTLGVITDAGLAPDPSAITDRFQEELAILLKLAQQELPAAEAPTSAERHQCEALTKTGRRCRNRAAEGSRYCRVHQREE